MIWIARLLGYSGEPYGARFVFEIPTIFANEHKFLCDLKEFSAIGYACTLNRGSPPVL